MKLLFLLLIFGLFSLGSTNAQTFTVVNTNDSGAGSLRDAINLASDGDTIRFSNTLISLGSNSIILDSNITFNTQLTIKGLYTSTDTLYISGGGNGRIFNYYYGSRLNLDSVVLIDGLVGVENGGAVRFHESDSLFIYNSIFEGNSALSGGGAVAVWTHITPTYLRMDNCLVRNNYGGQGGGVRCYAGYSQAAGVFNNCTFEDNTGGSGGGLSYFSVNNSLLEVQGCSFIGNSANSSGGLAASGYTGGSLTITNTICNGNSALNGNTGGMSLEYNSPNWSEIVLLDNVTVNNNTCTGSGGGVSCNVPDFTVLNSQIDDNVAGTCPLCYGGGIYCFIIKNLSGTSVSNNLAQRGGGIHYSATSWSVSSPPSYIDSSTISGNSVTLRGGGIHTVIPVVITNSVMDGNHADDAGGAIWCEKMTLNGTSLINNSAGLSGGGIRMFNNTLSINSNSDIANNTAMYGGGVYAVSGYDTGTVKINVADSKFEGNSAEYGGGICAKSSKSTAYPNELNLINSIIKGNTALYDGGGAYVFTENDYQFNNGQTHTQVSLSNGTVEQNSAGNNGGGIFLYTRTEGDNNSTPRSTLTVDHSTISDNDAGANGGGLYCAAVTGIQYKYLYSNVTLNHSTVTNNTAAISGGGVYSYSYRDSSTSILVYTESTVDLTNSTVYGNDAPVYGGGLFVHSSSSATTVTSTINTMSSIIAHNGVYNIRNNHLPTIVSGGNNIFSNPAINGSVASDQLAVDQASLNIGALASNGGSTLTRMPISPSVAIDMGNPTDVSDAQNVPIVGVREVGSAEVCSASASTDVIVECGSYTWIDGITYTMSNDTAQHILPNAAGCDSVISLELTLYGIEGVDVQTACDTYTWMDGQTYTSSNNVATYLMTNAYGCDSTVTLDLTITNSSFSIDPQTACDSLVWIDGTTYTSSNNVASYTLTNMVGCDSIITLDLTVNYSNSATHVQTACNSYTWMDGNTYTTNNNVATWTLTNAFGCDSVVTLDLTVNYSNSGTDVQTACDTYTWIDGNTYTSSTNTPTWTLTNASGCDSVITLDLTVNTINTLTTQLDEITIEANSSGLQYQWLDCDNNFASINGETNQTFTAAQNGSYAVQLSANGCVDTSECVNITNVGIIENDFGNNLKVYPNPTDGNLIISLGTEYQFVEVTTTDINGKNVSNEFFNESGILDVTIDGESGTYILKISSEGKNAQVKIVKK